jgi:3D (Asp-Asp-Asp) domain-containing protein
MSGIINILLVFMTFSFFATGLECYLLYGKKENIFKVILTIICAIATIALCFIHLNETLDNLDKKNEIQKSNSKPQSWPKEIQLKKFKATFYNPTKGQCDGDPLTTASGFRIDVRKVKKRVQNIVAVSRDLLPVYPYGSTIYVHYPLHLRGNYKVEDTMNKRFKKRIDFLVYDKIVVDSVQIL